MDDYCETLSDEEMNCFDSHEYVQESINNYYNNFVKKQVVKEAVKEVKPVIITIESLLQQNKVSVRTHNVLIVAGYKTLNEVNEKVKSIYDLMKIRNLGRSSIKEVAELLKSNFNVSYEL